MKIGHASINSKGGYSTQLQTKHLTPSTGLTSPLRTIYPHTFFVGFIAFSTHGSDPIQPLWTPCTNPLLLANLSYLMAITGNTSSACFTFRFVFDSWTRAIATFLRPIFLIRRPGPFWLFDRVQNISNSHLRERVQ